MELKCYIVDAFTRERFHGNPAAVCVLEKWLTDALMQSIAIENNLSETAFVVRENVDASDGEHWHLRWFTPGGEIDLCGHATLGTSFVLKTFVAPDAHRFIFRTMKNELVVTEEGGRYTMQFPAYDLKPVPVTDAMAEATGARPREAYLARDLLLVYDDERIVREMTPDQAKLKELDGLLVHVTAPGSAFDCVSRSFAPKLAVPEDPVCGSGHCHIVPYWTKRLGKPAIHAYQASRRGGELWCRQDGASVELSGDAVLYSKATLHL